MWRSAWDTFVATAHAHHIVLLLFTLLLLLLFLCVCGKQGRLPKTKNALAELIDQVQSKFVV